MPGSLLGNAVRRVEDPAFLTGSADFVDDLRRDDTLFCAFVRSPVAHARVTGIDTGEAAAAPGVVAVLTGEDLGDAPVPAFMTANERAVRPALARGRVRYVGDPVAMVVADSRARAVDALELVDVDYDPLPAVADMEAALADDAPQQFHDIPGNVAVAAATGDDDPLAGARHVVRMRMENRRLATSPIEGHAVLVDPTGDVLTAWLATQQPHRARDDLAEYTGLETHQVRVVVPHVGGAFGGKAGVTPEYAAAAAAARRLGRPLAWTETRSEAMLSMHGRGQVHYAELGLDGDARITGLRLRVVGDCGAYAGFGGLLAVGPTRMMAQGPYEIPRLGYAGIAALTNTTPVGAFRGAGRPEATAMLERLMDLAADELGLAPEEIRRRNLIPPTAFPYATRTGVTYDVADFDLPLREALRVADVDGARAEQARRREAGETLQLGIGIAVYIEITAFGGSEFASVHVHADGTATLSAGTSSHGQGHATSFSMIVADRLGIPLADLRYEQSDTAKVRSGGGTGGSRSLQLGGSAVAQAADEVRERALDVAARLLEADSADVVLQDEAFFVEGVPGSSVGWAEVAAYAHEHDGGLGSDTDFHQDGATFPFGAHVSVVEVDTETGRTTPLRHVAVDDCGRVVNPAIVAGQQHGGAVQGISQALWEEFVYANDGTPLTTTFADYALPTAADTIPLEVSSTETPTPLNPLGAKGIGESATIGATPAVQNAVVDAVRHLGVRHVDLPCTPERVWRAIRAAQSGPVPLWSDPPEAFDRLATQGRGGGS